MGRNRAGRLWIWSSLVTSMSQPLRKLAPGGRWKLEVEGSREIIGVMGRDIIRGIIRETERETVKNK